MIRSICCLVVTRDKNIFLLSDEAAERPLKAFDFVQVNLYNSLTATSRAFFTDLLHAKQKLRPVKDFTEIDIHLTEVMGPQLTLDVILWR